LCELFDLSFYFMLYSVSSYVWELHTIISYITVLLYFFRGVLYLRNGFYVC